ncbi:hypothetical protein ACOMHN_011069 [Nucella lapillus]
MRKKKLGQVPGFELCTRFTDSLLPSVAPPFSSASLFLPTTINDYSVFPATDGVSFFTVTVTVCGVAECDGGVLSESLTLPETLSTRPVSSRDVWREPRQNAL